MGKHMATNLIAAKHQVAIFDVNPQALDHFKDQSRLRISCKLRIDSFDFRTSKSRFRTTASGRQIRLRHLDVTERQNCTGCVSIKYFPVWRKSLSVRLIDWSTCWLEQRRRVPVSSTAVRSMSEHRKKWQRWHEASRFVSSMPLFREVRVCSVPSTFVHSLFPRSLQVSPVLKKEH